MALSPKHREFINQYIACYFNATEAYKRVYPKSSYDAARAHGARLVANGNIAAEIQLRLDELVMGKDEVLIRLAEHAKADIKDFLAVAGNGDVALDIAGAEGKTHLIKKVTQRRTIRTTKDSHIEEAVLTLELHDAQAALVQIGKHHKLFADKVEHDGEVLIRVKYGDQGNDDPSA